MNRPDEHLRQQQAIYRALQIIGGHIGLPILLLFSIFSKTAQRDLTFLNFCFTLYRLGPSSVFVGVALPFIHSDQECSNQAALVSGAEVMTDTAMCALIVQLWFDFRAAIHGPRSPRQIRWTRATVDLIRHHLSLVLMKPFFTTTASISALLYVQFRFGRLMASQKSFYCMLYNNNTFLISQYTVLVSILIVTLIFDGCIIHILYRRWRFFQRTGGKALGVPLPVVFRVVIFCACRIVIAVAYMATMLNAQRVYVLTAGVNQMAIFASASFIPVWADMLQAGTPLVAFLIFGTSKEFLDALMFWRWFNPILATSMCRRKMSPVTPKESNAYGEV
ncbi:hypothetical protein JB92DRAFT_2965266, partial [Gautieria morchelliformis]